MELLLLTKNLIFPILRGPRQVHAFKLLASKMKKGNTPLGFDISYNDFPLTISISEFRAEEDVSLIVWSAANSFLGYDWVV